MSQLKFYCICAGEEPSAVPQQPCVLFQLYGDMATEEQTVSCVQGGHDKPQENTW